VNLSCAQGDEAGHLLQEQDGYGLDCNSQHTPPGPSQMRLAQDQDMVQGREQAIEADEDEAVCRLRLGSSGAVRLSTMSCCRR
jgi:hypothetical protein